MSLYSIKMRASKGEKHVSGAERILESTEIAKATSRLTERALHHSLGQADFINLKIEALDPDHVRYLDALPVSTKPCDTIEESFQLMEELLKDLGISAPESLVKLLQDIYPMRGAVLYDVATQQRLEPDKNRGIRVTYMDSTEAATDSSSKNHFREALVLATKVISTPGMLAELCMSDDPEYVTGYIASRKHGYVRLTPLKKLGDPHGGRIFIFDSRLAAVETAIHYLEKEPVLVKGLPLEKPATADPEAFYAAQLAELKSQQLYRSMRTMTSEQARHSTVNNKPMLLMSSNSYLDLAADPRVKEAAVQAALQWGAGSGGSRLTTGNTLLAEQLEKRLAKLKNKEACVLFNTGYMANLGIISALADKETVIFSDETNHASIIDGARLSKGKIVVYKHNDMADLERKIAQTPCSRGLIVSDAVFSMDGDILNLPEYVALGKKYHLLTIVDEAHATGVIGATGKGIVEHFHNQYEPDIIMGTLSKSLGAEGGFACASRTIVEYLLNKARSFIFSTAQCAPALGAALKALDILESEPERVQALQHNVAYFCQCLKDLHIEAASPTAIIPVLIGDEGKAMQVAKYLEEKGVLIPAIRYPTVPKNTARLRVALMATHTEEELKHTAELIREAIDAQKQEVANV